MYNCVQMLSRLLCTEKCVKSIFKEVIHTVIQRRIKYKADIQTIKCWKKCQVLNDVTITCNCWIKCWALSNWVLIVEKHVKCKKMLSRLLSVKKMCKVWKYVNQTIKCKKCQL